RFVPTMGIPASMAAARAIRIWYSASAGGRPSARARSVVIPWMRAAPSGIGTPGSISQLRASTFHGGSGVGVIVTKHADTIRSSSTLTPVDSTSNPQNGCVHHSSGIRGYLHRVGQLPAQLVLVLGAQPPPAGADGRPVGDVAVLAVQVHGDGGFEVPPAGLRAVADDARLPEGEPVEDVAFQVPPQLVEEVRLLRDLRRDHGAHV